MSHVLIEEAPVLSSRKSGFRPSFDHLRRRRELCERMGKDQTCPEAILIVNPLDIFYLTGVREGISWLVVWKGGCLAVSRHMLLQEVIGTIRDCEVLLPTSRSTDPAKPEAFVVAELARRSLRRVVVETGNLSAASYIELSRLTVEAGVDLLPVKGFMESLRQSKDDDERALIQKCAEIAGKALAGLIEGGASALLGRTEREVAHELEVRMFQLGADRQGFPEPGVIVAGGPNSASPHHVPGSRRIAVGEPLLIDWGAELAGYRSDMTRTFFIGQVPEFALRAYPVVETALNDAADLLTAGSRLGEIDRVARNIVVSAGYPEFHYGVGHGVGLSIHEAPWIRAHSEEIATPGMITTIEPGVYLPGIGGIRIESMFAISDGAPQQIDDFPTSLDTMILD